MYTTLAILAAGFAAGLLASMMGVGGGFLLVPFLALLVGLPMHVSIGISLSSIVATSISSTMVYARDDLVDFKLGLLLETTTSLGAILGSYTALGLPEDVLKTIFGMSLIYASYRIFKGSSTAEGSMGRIGASRLAAGLALSFLAGMASGLLGIGGGTIKVPMMILVLGIPTKIAIATSSFMVGITASAAALVYQSKGLITPLLVSSAITGIFLGSQLGSRIALKARGTSLRRLFGAVLFFFAFRMLLSGLGVVG